jgi:hypothetical protein
MSQLLIILLILAVVALAAVVALLSLRLRSVTRREGMQALAARRGWALTLVDGKLGRPSLARIAPRGGAGWQVTARYEAATTPPWSTLSESTTFATEEPVWPDGLILIAPMPADASAPQLPHLAELGLTAGTTALARMLAPWPGPPGLALWATADPARRADWSDIAKILVAAGPTVTGQATFPLVMLGPDGLTLHHGRDIKRADRMEAFIDLGLDLARVL